MEYKMKLSQEEKDILSGSQGKTMAKILETIVRFGEIFGATHLVPVKGKGHFVISIGLEMFKPFYKIIDEIIDSGLKVNAGFTVDPRPTYEGLGCNILEKYIFKKKMYTCQEHYEEQLHKIGLLNNNAFTCACYLDEVGNIPLKGEYLSWAESSAVSYANSVLGARCNRNSGVLEIFGSIAGKVPCFGLLTDEGRKASWVIELKCKKIPEAQILGSAIGMKVMEDVPYIKGLDSFLGQELTNDVKGYLKDMGAAAASNGAVGLYHVENMTPEAKELGEKLILNGAKHYLIDDEELERVMNSYPVMWKNKKAKPKICFIGCPHLSMTQLEQWTDKISDTLKKTGRKRVKVKTVLSTAPDLIANFKTTPRYETLSRMGVILSDLCPLMYTSNPLSALKPIITNSNKLRTYSVARYYPDNAILDIITGREG